MGLDIYCDDVGARVGSYSGVHDHRKILLKCALYYIQYLIDNREKTKLTNYKDELNALKEHLDKMLIGKKKSLNVLNTDVSYYDPINYHHYYQNENDINSLLKLFNLEGVLYFVIHSDCEGEITSSESKAFIDFLSITISKSLPYFADEENKKPLDDQDNNDECGYSIFNLFRDEFNINCNNYNDFDQENIHKHYYLYDVFQKSVDSGNDVVFC